MTNGPLELLEFLALFLLKTETCREAKNSSEFIEIICLVKIGFKKRQIQSKFDK